MIYFVRQRARSLPASTDAKSGDPQGGSNMTGPGQGPARSVIVHDFFVTEGGADRCAIEFAQLLPDAEIYTSFFDERQFGDRIAAARVHSWILQRLLGPTRHFRSLLPLYPIYFSRLNVGHAGLILSSSIAFTKAVHGPPGSLHISYVYTPLRYAWDLDTYLSGSSLALPARVGARVVRPVLRRWDRATSARPDVIVAISKTVQTRIRDIWGRDSTVIYPPVDVDEIGVSRRDDGYLLVAARMLAYRRLDLVVAACRVLRQPLVVVGDGPESARLRQIAGPETRFEGYVSRKRLLELLGGCSAYVVPGVEDFGIAPVEAMAAGKPVIAFGVGGVAETVVGGETGIFFDSPTVEALVQVIEQFKRITFDPDRCRSRAEEYSRTVFLDAWRALFVDLGVDPSVYSQR
jgi:glycosyltransferase involved in cell wall biosynthesis